MLEYLDHRATSDKIYLPDCHLHIYDDEDNIIMQLIYKGVGFRSISDIDFRKTDRGIISKEFDLVLSFNDFFIDFNFENFQSTRNADDHEYEY